MDNILNRFNNGIQTAIDYTRLPCVVTPEAVPPPLFETIKAKFGLAKDQFSSIDNERRNDKEEEQTQKPS